MAYTDKSHSGRTKRLKQKAVATFYNSNPVTAVKSLDPSTLLLLQGGNQAIYNYDITGNRIVFDEGCCPPCYPPTVTNIQLSDVSDQVPPPYDASYNYFYDISWNSSDSDSYITLDISSALPFGFTLISTGDYSAKIYTTDLLLSDAVDLARFTIVVTNICGITRETYCVLPTVTNLTVSDAFSAFTPPSYNYYYNIAWDSSKTNATVTLDISSSTEIFGYNIVYDTSYSAILYTNIILTDDAIDLARITVTATNACGSAIQTYCWLPTVSDVYVSDVNTGYLPGSNFYYYYDISWNSSKSNAIVTLDISNEPYYAYTYQIDPSGNYGATLWTSLPIQYDANNRTITTVTATNACGSGSDTYCKYLTVTDLYVSPAYLTPAPSPYDVSYNGYYDVSWNSSIENAVVTLTPIYEGDYSSLSYNYLIVPNGNYAAIIYTSHEIYNLNPTAMTTVNVTLNVSNACGPKSVTYSGFQPCFLAGSLVQMADGSQKVIEDVRVGDTVLGAFGETNTVVALHRPLLGTALMCKINGEHSTTNHHPHISVDRKFYCGNPALVSSSTYGHVHKVIDATGAVVDRMLHGLKKERILQLDVGVELKTVEGSRITKTLETYSMPPQTQLYNLVVDGSHTYHVEGYAVTGWPREDDFDYDTWTAF